MTEFSTLGIVFNLLLLIIYYSLLHKSWKKPDSIIGVKLKFCYFLCLLFFLMPFYGGDYYSYREIFDNINKGKIYDIGSIEDIYIFIGQHSFNSYFIFRLIIWGTSMFLIIRTGYILRLKQDLFLFLLTCCFITVLAYARVTLAMAMIFYGAAKVSEQNPLNVLIGIVLILLSFFFHKSALFGIAIVILAYLITKLGRWTFIVFLFAIPLIISVLVYLVSDFLTSSVAQEYININSAQGYLTEEQQELGIGAMLLTILQRGPYYYLSLIFLIAVFSKEYNKWPKGIKLLGASAFLITITASLFTIDFGFNTYTLYYRFLTFATIPSLCLMCYLRTRNLYPRLLKFTCWSLILSVTYNISYTLYLSIIQ